MQAKAIRKKFERVPPEVAAFGSSESETHVSIGKRYEVHALSVYSHVVCLQVVNDVEVIAWLPAWFFEISDPTIPDDWNCNVFSGDLQMILGPDFVSRDEDSYRRMVEMHPESVDRFWRRTKMRLVRPAGET